MRSLLALALGLAAGAASAYRCPGELCDVPYNLVGSDCDSYTEVTLQEHKPKLQVKSSRTPVYDESYDNCQGTDALQVDIDEKKTIDASLEVSTNNSRALSTANSLALGIKDAVGINTGINTENVGSDGKKLTATDKIEFEIKVHTSVPVGKSLRVLKLAVAKSASRPGYYKLVQAHWIHSTAGLGGGDDPMSTQCRITVDGSGHGALRSGVTKAISAKCYCESHDEQPGGPGLIE